MFIATLTISACGTSAITKAPQVASLTACAATRDAARSASNVYYGSTSKYPTTFPQLTAGSTPALKVPDGTTVAPHAISAKGWKLTISGGGANPPEFVCANARIG